MEKHLLIEVLALALSTATVAAQTVAIQTAVSADSLPKDAPAETVAAMKTDADRFAGAVMEAFFDAGFVVTDARPVVVAMKEWENVRLGLDEARAGGVAWVLGVFIEFSRTETIPPAWVARVFRWRLVRVKDAFVAASGVIEAKSPFPPSGPDARKDLEAAGAEAAAAAIVGIRKYA